MRELICQCRQTVRQVCSDHHFDAPRKLRLGRRIVQAYNVALEKGRKVISVGVDVGAQSVKLVVFRDRDLLAHSIVLTGWDTAASLRRALKEATEEAAVRETDIDSVGATGMGRQSVPFATILLTDPTCSAKGATWFFDSARTVVDVGAERTHALTCDGEGRVLEYVWNDSCAVGAGAFIEEMASALEIDVRDMGRLSGSSQHGVTLNSTCTVFAESEVISLVSQGVSRADIARAICDAIAGKAASLLRGFNVQRQVVFIGGVAMNAGVADSLRHRLNLDIAIPDEPRIVSATGAAILASQAARRQAGDLR